MLLALFLWEEEICRSSKSLYLPCFGHHKLCVLYFGDCSFTFVVGHLLVVCLDDDGADGGAGGVVLGGLAGYDGPFPFPTNQ